MENNRGFRMSRFKHLRIDACDVKTGGNKKTRDDRPRHVRNERCISAHFDVDVCQAKSDRNGTLKQLLAFL